MVTRSKSHIVDLLLITIVVIWGFNFALMKFMYRYFHPIAFNAIRFVISSVTMVGILKLRGEEVQINLNDLRGILWLGFLGNTLYPFIFVLGLERTKAGNAALLMALTPVFAFLIAVAMKKEHFKADILIGITLSFTGAAAIVLFGTDELSIFDSWLGSLLMIGAAACWAWQKIGRASCRERVWVAGV